MSLIKNWCFAASATAMLYSAVAVAQEAELPEESAVTGTEVVVEAPAVAVENSAPLVAIAEPQPELSVDDSLPTEVVPAVKQETPYFPAQSNESYESSSSISVSKFILNTEIKPNSSVKLMWNPDAAVGGFSEPTPVLVVNGAMPGETLCMIAALHGDELNGIEMIRRVIFDIDPSKLTGTIIGVPVANIMGFRRNSRYLPDRRDWNRYFPGNTRGSSASRLAHSFFTNIILHCDAIVDIHTGSFHRTNLPQLRADLSDESVAKLAQSFGDIAVLNSRGHQNSLRAAAVRAQIPTVTMEAGEPLAMQRDIVDKGVSAINTLLAKKGMYGKQSRWNRIAPVYYRSVWVRANQSGILFSRATLGQRVKADEVLGTVTDPITNARSTIKSPFNGRIIGMALDQVVLPGFAAYHIGIQTPEAIMLEESQMNLPLEDDEDGDDAGIQDVPMTEEVPQERMNQS